MELPSAWIRHHVTPRNKLFDPRTVHDGPELEDLTLARTTFICFESGRDTSVYDINFTDGDPERETLGQWRGRSIFEIAQRLETGHRLGPLGERRRKSKVGGDGTPR